MDIILTAISILMIMFVAYELGKIALVRLAKNEIESTPVASNRARMILR